MIGIILCLLIAFVVQYRYTLVLLCSNSALTKEFLVFLIDDVACASPESCLRACGSKAGCTNIAFPKLVLGIMPTGI